MAALGVCLFLTLTCFRPVWPGEDHGVLLQELVDSLNAGSRTRAQVIDKIAQELAGPNRMAMQAMLFDGLENKGLLIKLGCVEALARRGQAADAVALTKVLPLLAQTEVRIKIIRLLPAFYLHSDERLRRAFIEAVDNQQGRIDKSLLDRLRLPPESRRGRFLPEQDEMRLIVERAIAGQLDPIATIIAQPDRGPSAREAISRYAGQTLGRDPAQWGTVWKQEGIRDNLPGATDLEEITLAALETLGEVGAEGTPAVLDDFRRLLSRNDDKTDTAALETLTQMCDNSRTSIAPAVDPSKLRERDKPLADAEAAWRARRLKDADALSAMAFETAMARLDAKSPDVRAAAAICLASAWPPQENGKDDAQRALAATQLCFRLALPNEEPKVRRAIVAALGKLPGLETVDTLNRLLDSPYVDASQGRDAMALTIAVAEALAEIALSSGPGNIQARQALLSRLGDDRKLSGGQDGNLSVTVGHVILWRLQRIAKTGEAERNPDFWRLRMGW